MAASAAPTPPYRADIVGSFLRPDAVKKARKAHFDDKTMSAAELKSVEDQAIIALDLESAVEESNGQVIGPASTVREALKLLHTNEVDAAILDANLPDGDVTPVAEQLIVVGLRGVADRHGVRPAPRCGPRDTAGR